MTMLSADDVRQATNDPNVDVVTAEQVAAWLPAEAPDSHKGTCGFALVIAGSVNYTGAAYLAGAGAYRAGAGLVTVAVPSRIHAIVAGLLPEATYLTLSEDLGVLSKPGAAVLREEWDRYQAVLLGPGLTDQRAAREFVETLLEPEEQAEQHGTGPIGFHTSADEATADQSDENSTDHPRPTHWVVDADGLNILAQWPEGLALLPPGSVLTPHPGEMARLTGLTAAEVNDARLETATKWASEWGHVVALKGALTVIAAPDGRATVVPFANPTLATAGSGDVMSGAVVGFLAQGVQPFEAAAAGAFAHGLAGELAARDHGSRGATATDIASNLSHAVAHIEDSSADTSITEDARAAESAPASTVLKRLVKAVEKLEGS